MTLKSPTTVRILGWLTALSALAYFVCVFLVFKPGMTKWRAHFVQYALLYVYPAIMCLLVYMYAKLNLGKALLKEDKRDEALAYSTPRIWPDFWLRGASEAMTHRTICLQVYLRNQQYDQAKALIESDDKQIKFKGRSALVFGQLSVELLLRQDNLVMARAQKQRFDHIAKPKSARADLMAALAEVEIRSNKRAQAQQFIDDAKWSDATSTRLALSQALFDMTFKTANNADILSRIEAIPASYFDTLPGLEAEWLLRQWQLTEDQNTKTALKTKIFEIKETWDARSTFLIEQTFQETH